MSNDIFRKYLPKPTESATLNTKLILLTKGIDCNFDTLQRECPDMNKKYKVNKIAVSDRHFISTKTEERNYIPDEIILDDGKHRTVVKAYYRADSPFMFSINEGKYVIREKGGSEFPVDVSIVKLPNYYKMKHNGVSLDKYVSIVGTDRISIIPYDGCENWIEGDQCKFCGANPKRLGFGPGKPNIGEIKSKFGGDHDAWWNANRDGSSKAIRKGLDALMKYDQLEPHTHFMLMGGNLKNSDLEWKLMFDTMDTIIERLELNKIDSYLILTPPNTVDELKKAKSYGFRNIAFNMECFDEKAFADTCPGKNREKILNAFKDSIGIFGEGNVRTNFVFGAEPMSTLTEGVKYLASEGVVSDYSVFFPRPGSVWSRREPPKPQDVLTFTKELVETYRKYDFRPFSCAMSSRSSVASDVFAVL